MSAVALSDAPLTAGAGTAMRSLASAFLMGVGRADGATAAGEATAAVLRTDFTAGVMAMGASGSAASGAFSSPNAVSAAVARPGVGADLRDDAGFANELGAARTAAGDGATIAAATATVVLCAGVADLSPYTDRKRGSVDAAAGDFLALDALAADAGVGAAACVIVLVLSGASGVATLAAGAATAAGAGVGAGAGAAAGRDSATLRCMAARRRGDSCRVASMSAAAARAAAPSGSGPVYVHSSCIVAGIVAARGSGGGV